MKKSEKDKLKKRITSLEFCLLYNHENLTTIVDVLNDVEQRLTSLKESLQDSSNWPLFLEAKSLGSVLSLVTGSLVTQMCEAERLIEEEDA